MSSPISAIAAATGSSAASIDGIAPAVLDVLLALGITPVSVYQFVPVMERGVGARAEPSLGDATPVVLTNPINFEQIATLHPT